MLDQVVALHLRAFPGFFLSYLGARFLRDFYASFVDDLDGVGLAAINENRVMIGVVVGPMIPRGFFGRLVRRRWWSLAVSCAAAAARKPSITPRLVRGLTYRGDPPPGEGLALLSSIAVAPEAQGSGVGKLLVESWLAGVRERGGKGAYLTTDALHNDGVNGFYQRLGWRIESSYLTREGRGMNRYVIGWS